MNRPSLSNSDIETMKSHLRRVESEASKLREDLKAMPLRVRRKVSTISNLAHFCRKILKEN